MYIWLFGTIIYPMAIFVFLMKIERVTTAYIQLFLSRIVPADNSCLFASIR